MPRRYFWRYINLINRDKPLPNHTLSTHHGPSSGTIFLRRDNIRYICLTFPSVERPETDRWDHYRSRDLALAYVNALLAGKPDAGAGAKVAAVKSASAPDLARYR